MLFVWWERIIRVCFNGYFWERSDYLLLLLFYWGIDINNERIVGNDLFYGWSYKVVFWEKWWIRKRKLLFFWGKYKIRLYVKNNYKLLLYIVGKWWMDNKI